MTRPKPIIVFALVMASMWGAREIYRAHACYTAHLPIEVLSRSYIWFSSGHTTGCHIEAEGVVIGHSQDAENL